ncbi:BQ5605_C020g09102 [Microbotryum silenes-dioicae]|uniref:BQ5605_C020g09102 protein n=1 Tax=Microbotryum silenes-dioicae TaxID=796604 RepID=A0A2X0MJR7_9BASI|nr:BQ5605_C020g09102 [Microbotryum silenes-dioicae]
MPYQLSTARPGKSEYPLPPPAVAFQPPSAKDGLKVRWSKIKRRIGNGSAPGTSRTSVGFGLGMNVPSPRPGVRPGVRR